MVYVAVYLRECPDGWPLDHGDDPAFGSSRRFRGRVTWGVCRPNVRNAVRPGDAVIFFAADRLRDRRPEAARYQFVGFATVDRSVRQTDVWCDRSLRIYQRYGNLLIRPAGRAFEHFEPELPRKHWHEDWLARISERRTFSRADFDGRERFAPSDKVNGRPLRLAPNYVIFRPEPQDTFILAEPPVVATVSEAGRPETWLKTPFASALRSIVLSPTHRSLRTTHPQVAHPHIAIPQEAEPVLSQIRRLCAERGLATRDSRRAVADETRSPAKVRARVC